MSSDTMPSETLPDATDAGFAIRVTDLSKHYMIYARPEDRLKQSIIPRLQRLVGQPSAKYYRDFAALNGVSFDVGHGETVGIVGRNGSGKSTLLQVICGTLQPSSGTVEVRGRIAALLELGAGFNPEFTGRENVYLNASILGLSREETDARFDAIAAFADIGQFLDQPVKTYSSGMFVRLAFGVAINVDPDILIVDEALSVGDEAFQRKCFARIEQIKDRGATILFVSHGTQTIVQLCDRAILMDGGEAILDGAPKLVTGLYQKLIYAPPERVAEIRAEIASGTAATAVADAVADAARPAVDLSAEQFDPSLVPHSTIEYAENGAAISNVRITNSAGVPVNTLIHGQRYSYSYECKFTTDRPVVAFAMLLKTTTGVEIFGQCSHGIGGGMAVRSDDDLAVTFTFTCLFLPGIYFGNAGTFINGAGDFEQLHRIIDATMFRVAPYLPERAIMGLVNMALSDEDGTLSEMSIRNTANA
jgi:lipopolysaccharide transport system ATP-binding protein